MKIYETMDNNAVEMVVKGDERPSTLHYDNEFVNLTVKQGKQQISINMNHEDIVELSEQLREYVESINKQYGGKSE